MAAKLDNRADMSLAVRPACQRKPGGQTKKKHTGDAIQPTSKTRSCNPTGRLSSSQADHDQERQADDVMNAAKQEYLKTNMTEIDAYELR